MSTFSIDLTPAQETRLIKVARAQGVAPETVLRHLVTERLSEPGLEQDSFAQAQTYADMVPEASTPIIERVEMVDEGGVLVLAHLNVDITDWDSLVEREREARIDILSPPYNR